MTRKRKTAPVTFREVEQFQSQFAAWLEQKAGKQAKAAFYGLLLLDVISRLDAKQQGRVAVAHARYSLYKLLNKPKE